MQETVTELFCMIMICIPTVSLTFVSSPFYKKILCRYLPEPGTAHIESGNIFCPVFANSFWSTKGANANSILIHPMRSHSNKTYSKIKKSGSGDGILGVSNQCGLEDIWPPGIGQYYRHFANPERYSIRGSIWAPIAFFRIQNPGFHGATVNIFEKYRVKRLFSKTERFKPNKIFRFNGLLRFGT